MTNTNKDIFAKAYAECFIEAYPHLPADKSKDLIEKALGVALKNIRAVSIEGAAFEATFKKLGIKPTYKAIEEFLA